MLLYNPIVVFDSGIGSLSIVRELRKEMPFENILYFADRKHFPYGDKAHNILLQILTDTINYLQQYRPKVIVIASNTPSIQVLHELRIKSKSLIMGVIPPFEEASRLTRKKHIGILGTTGMIRSKELDNEIKKKIPQNILVSRFDASQIVKLVEQGIHLTNERRTYDTILNTLNERLDQDVDVIVLASTHLPFVRKYIGSLFPSIRLVDPSRSAARQVKKFLVTNRMLKKAGKGRLEILVSDRKEEFEKTLRKMGVIQPVKEVITAF
jgi:glutamate racemase